MTVDSPFALALALAALLITLAPATNAGRASPPPGAPARLAVWIGTYTNAGSRGIYRAEFDAGTGELSGPALAAETANPSFLALHPDGRVLYAVNEVAEFGGARSGAVSAFAIDSSTGGLTLVGQRQSGGADPCHLSVDRAGRHLFVANYTGGSVAVVPLGGRGELLSVPAVVPFTGRGPDPKRQQGPHAHQIVLDPSERFALAADLGTDRILVFRYGPDRGTLEPNDPPSAALVPGSGPRHVAWHPNGRYVYALAELTSAVTPLRWDTERGTLEALQTVTTLPVGFAGENTGAGIAVSGDGRFLYASNRGHDSVAVFAVDQQSGTLTPAGHVSVGGRSPRHFAIDPTGRWLLAANQASDSITVFRIDPATGLLRAAGRPLAISRPVCLLFGGAFAPH